MSLSEPVGMRRFDAEKLLIAPSLLAADFSCLTRQMSEAEATGIQVFHVDIMDGHFVPNLSMGPCVVSGIRKATKGLLDVHLMISQPLKYARAFAEAGADHITFHVESEDDPNAVLHEIANLGCSAGLTLKPGTPVEQIEPWLDKVDMVLVMTVEPGFGGQSFMGDMLGKVSFLRQWSRAHGSRLHVEVDGGVGLKTAARCVTAGANVLVAGNAVFRAPAGISAVLNQLRDVPPLGPTR